MSRPDDIVALIDGGLQSSREHGYGDPCDPGEATCVRCFATVTAEAAICEPCRAYVTGESDTDPAEHKRETIEVSPLAREFVAVAAVFFERLSAWATSALVASAPYINHLAAHGVQLADLATASIDPWTGETLLADGRRVPSFRPLPANPETMNRIIGITHMIVDEVQVTFQQGDNT